MARSVLIFMVFLPYALAAQTISGRILNKEGRVLANANVLLLAFSDSSLVKGAVTDESGNFILRNMLAGRYLIAASGVGYRQVFSSAITVGEGSVDHLVPVLILPDESTALKEVTVTARRPFIEQRPDRTIVNVANSIVSSGATALEVLEKSPGVSIDRQNDQISFRGREGVIVQIDGRPTYLPMPELVALLRNMPSDNIDRIEILSNPSAKYDASGNAAIIDIRLKKNNNLGTNGSLSLGGGSGRYGRLRGNAQVNHRAKKFQLFGNFNAYRDGGYWDFDIQRIQEEAGDKNFINSRSYIKTLNSGYNTRAGLEYYLGRRTSVGISGSASWNWLREKSPAHAIFRKEPSGPVFRHTLSDKRINSHPTNTLGSLSFLHQFKKEGVQLSADFDIGRYHRSFSNSLLTSVLAGPPAPEYGLVTIMPTIIDILTLKSDYSQPLSRNWKLEAGLKGSSVESDNNVELKSGEKDQLERDTLLSNHFIYQERVLAGYLNFSGKLSEKMNLMVGLRAEHTASEGNSINLKQLVKRDYLDLFPSAFLSRTLHKDHHLSVSYSYRIDRPNYQFLNPARSYLDPYTYSSGNAFLNPQYTHSFEMKHGFREKVHTSFALSVIEGMQFHVIQSVDAETSRRMPENIGQARTLSLTVSFPVKVTNSWDIQVSLMGNSARFSYNYKESRLRAHPYGARLNASQSFRFGKGWSAEITGQLSTPSVYVFARSPRLGFLDAGLQKNMGNRWKWRLSMQDILHTNRIIFRMDMPNFSSDGRIFQDTRFFMLNLSYSFGNQQLKTVRQRKAASEEEMQRTN